MTRKWPALLIAMTAAFSVVTAAVAAPQPCTVRPIHLRTEFLSNPAALNTRHPRFSWQLAPTRANAHNLIQTAWRIDCADAAAGFPRSRAKLWSSGWIPSAQQNQLVYCGRALHSRERVCWRVQVRDRSGTVSRWSPVAMFGVGLLRRDQWHAHWIEQSASETGPLPLFRYAFHLAAQPVRATLRICGLGQFAAWVSGHSAGRNLLQPGWTNYRKTDLYRTFDVTRLVQRGANSIAVMLGNGMYNVQPGRYSKFLGSFGPPKLIAELTLHMPDGATRYIGTSKGWLAAPGPITFSSIYGGEDYDARLTPSGWKHPGYKPDQRWHPAVRTHGPGGRLEAEMTPPERVYRVLTPVKPPQPLLGQASNDAAADRHLDGWVYDFGQNSSAVPWIEVSGAPGSVVRLTPSELLKNGRPDQSQTGAPVYYQVTLRGKRPEVWRPLFGYGGFRYLQVTGAAPAGLQKDGEPVVLGVRAEVLTPAAPQTGWFRCSSTLLNQVHHLIVWAIRSNMKSILTDCPHRERLGWLEQDWLMGPGVMFNFGCAPLYEKIERDMAASQTPGGLIPDIAPEYVKFGDGFRDSPEWGSACICGPWEAWRTYGDRRILARSYTTMRRYANYLWSLSRGRVLRYGLGDWADWAPHNTPLGLTATATFCLDLQLMAAIARLVGRPADSAQYAARYRTLRRAFDATWLDAASGTIAEDSDAANAIALCCHLIPHNLRAGILHKLVDAIQQRGWHTTAGDVGNRFVLRALAEGGRSDVVTKMALQTASPSYGYQVTHGATTLTENWDGPTSGASQNHFMMGHIEEWYERFLAGISQPAGTCGYCRIVIQPWIAPQLRYVVARFNSASGAIRSGWKRTGSRVRLTVQIPANCTGDVVVPTRGVRNCRARALPVGARSLPRYLGNRAGEPVYRVASGTWSFSFTQQPEG
ncbi:MAG: family 78 glycoside hydrolase catalytic domain [Armatimonadetes bacterium]|nr:family 78 glycoside hydrolase catalytic domain [Armatimonadota bacterium]MDE2205163.1 family 78 glycoside hydrolase catalytic domain [Armatimonadota bacterium]